MRAQPNIRQIALFLATMVLTATVGRTAPSEPLPQYFRTGTLTIADRVWAEAQIERVRYERRSWPRDNPFPKPEFEQAVPAAKLEARVRDLLDRSAALSVYWKRPITPAMLQAELDRMVRGTRDPKSLEAMFAALHHDPLLIAETLARPLLVDRLIHSWYAQDQRFHAEARREAESLAVRSEAGDWSRITYVEGEPTSLPGGEQSVSVDDLESLSRDAATWGRGGRLDETVDGFVLKRLRRATSGRLEIETLTVPKTSFDSWWRVARGSVHATEADPQSTDHVYRIGRLTSSAPICELSRAGAASATASPGCDAWAHPPGFLDGTAEGRVHFSAVWTGSEMIVWGGITGRILDSGARYDPATDTWTPTSRGANHPSARRYHVAVWTGTEMLIWGGADNVTAFQDGARYDPASDTWTPIGAGAGLPAARQQATAVWTGTEMIVWGGLPFSGNYFNSGGRYDPALDSWTPTSTGANVPLARALHSAVWTGSQMIVFGGQSNLNPLLGAGGRYDPATDTWTPHTTTGQPAARFAHTGVWTGTEMIVWGGGNNLGVYFNTGARYNPVSDTWTATTTTNAPPVRSSHLVVWTGSQMIVWGGTNTMAQFLTTGGRYDPVTDGWTATSTTNVPPGRVSGQAVWTGSEMIVWGGANSTVGGDVFKSGARYDPSGDTWVPTAIGTEMPSGRYNTPSVWTGDEFIVWGGASFGSAATISGGRYEPATDAWRPVSQGGSVPSARGGHAAVWSGTEMIVWGGQGSLALQTGGRYDPATDSWQATSLTNAPLARINHTAIWTGSQMVVWGGVNSSTTQNTGGRYTPATNLWSTTSVTNVPGPRSAHTAVWTGTEMIIWGGVDGLTYLNSGGRYNPTTNVWTATSVGANVPTARATHAAVWTGSEMVVWGGIAGSTTYFNTGGRYAPSTNTWLPTSTGSGVPTARAFFTAVWSGNEIFVWGGANQSSKFSDGSRYSPNADSWNPMLTVGGPPSARWKHLAAWTGTSVLVWGGATGFGLETNLATGGFYDFAKAGSPGNTLRLAKVGSTVELTWSTIDNADSYTVRRCGEPVGCYPDTIIASPTSATYSEAILPGESHFYLIEASNPCGVTP